MKKNFFFFEYSLTVRLIDLKNNFFFLPTKIEKKKSNLSKQNKSVKKKSRRKTITNNGIQRKRFYKIYRKKKNRNIKSI